MQEDNKMAQENNEKERQKMTMTKTSETLQPGRELDAKVYEATGRTWFECWNYEDVYDDELGEVVRYEPLEVLEEVPHYSTSIEAAWPLVEKNKFILIPPNEILGKWQACVTIGLSPHLRYLGYGDTAPHAICLAYLALVENEGKE